MEKGVDIHTYSFNEPHPMNVRRWKEVWSLILILHTQGRLDSPQPGTTLNIKKIFTYMYVGSYEVW